MCKNVNEIDLNDYDILLIPGGLPSSGALRRNRAFLNNLKQFYFNEKNNNKVVAAICSGTEVLISAEILNNLPGAGNVTGSPASIRSFFAWLGYYG